MSCSIASVTSYLRGIEAKNLQNGDVHIAQIRDLKWNISRTIWRIEVGDGSFFCIFHALSFELNFLFDRRFPLILQYFSSPVFMTVSILVNNLDNSFVVHLLEPAIKRCFTGDLCSLGVQ